MALRRGQKGWVHNVSKRISASSIALMVSGEGRKVAEAVAAQLAAGRQPRPKIGY